MTKILYLLRHAQSAEKQQGQADKDRELTPVGIKETLQIGTYLYQKKIMLDAIFYSVAVRAQTTAQLISDTLKINNEKIIPEDELFQASVRTFFEFIGQLDDTYNHVMCVGHNPVISYLAEYLCKEEIGDMPPAGLTIIRFNIHTWKDVKEGNGEMVTFVTPKEL